MVYLCSYNVLLGIYIYIYIYIICDCTCMDHVEFNLVHCTVYTIIHVHIVFDYLCRCVSDN